MLKDFILKKVLEQKLKQLPAEQREIIINMASKNPALLQSIASDVEARVKKGEDQASAMAAVAKEREAELKQAFTEAKN